MKTSVACILAVALIGCGDDDDGGTGADASIDSSSGTVDGGADATAPDPLHEWSAIISADWTVAAGTEKYFCASKTLTEDVYVGGYRPIDPAGTHHTALTFGPPSGPDNPGHDCSAGVENPLWIYASGVGTNELKLPAGVGMKLPKGQQVHVNLHLFNTSDAPISGKSGVEVFRLAEEEVVNEAEMFLPGPVQFSIPSGQGQSITGNCTLRADQHLVALFPHMHQLGSHFKTELVHADGTSVTLHDDDYQFDSQEFLPLSDVTATMGDKIRTTCTWNNNTGAAVPFGDSSRQEMCFSVLIRYPRLTAPGARVLCPN